MSYNSRRKFLQNSASVLSLAGLSHGMANAVIQSIAKSAFANSASNLASTKKYIYLSLDSAPPRWFFDIPLTPNSPSTDYYPKNNTIGNYINRSGNDIIIENRPWKDPASGLYLPPVWGSNPKTASGDFANLKNNLFFFRGVDMEIDNHTVTRLRNQAPTIGGFSIAGMFSSRTSSPIPSVVSGSIGDSFRAEKIISPITVAHTGVSNTNNSITTAMNYVAGATPVKDSLMKQQLSFFDSYARSNGFANYGIKEAKDKADSMIIEGVKQFTDQWSTIYGKYTALIKEAMQNSKNRDKFATTQAIPNTRDYRMTYQATGGILSLAEISDVKSTTTSDKCAPPQMAAIFACLEILIVNGITSVCVFSLPNGVMDNVQRTNSGATFNMNSDQHTVGTLLSTYVTSHFYRCLLICMDEFARVLTSNNMWKDTLIQFGSEFGRNPRENLSGSDHQTMAGSALLVSGSFNENRIVGNLVSNARSGYRGFTGTGTGIANLNGAQLRVNDIVKTVSHFLDIRPPTENGASLLLLTKNQLEKKNVA